MEVVTLAHQQQQPNTITNGKAVKTNSVEKLSADSANDNGLRFNSASPMSASTGSTSGIWFL
jgi:hypothetical protein